LRANAQLKTWHIQRKLRRSPSTPASAKRIYILQSGEIERLKGSVTLSRAGDAPIADN
jgi:hypothetical protein